MYNEVVNKIIEAIDEKLLLTEAYPKFSGGGYKAHKIDIKNFHQLITINSGKKIAFVDGGSAEIIASANFSLNLVRAVYVIYQNNRKKFSKKLEFFAFVRAVNKNNEICYQASIIGLENSNFLDEITFNSFDPTLMLGINRAEITNVANAIRRFAELIIAKSISDERLADLIVLDGNLQSTITNENKYLNELFESCGKNEVILTALSKTTSLFTENGNLLSAVLSGMSGIDSWFYNPIADINNKNHQAEMYFVKFHEKSKHVFRFEIFNKQKSRGEETINILARSCVDPIFIGYPYGLVEADRIARVSNSEKESLKTILLVKLNSKKIEKYLSSRNAHEILDKISY